MPRSACTHLLGSCAPRGRARAPFGGRPRPIHPPICPSIHPPIHPLIPSPIPPSPHPSIPPIHPSPPSTHPPHPSALRAAARPARCAAACSVACRAARWASGHPGRPPSLQGPPCTGTRTRTGGARAAMYGYGCRGMRSWLAARDGPRSSRAATRRPQAWSPPTRPPPARPRDACTRRRRRCRGRTASMALVPARPPSHMTVARGSWQAIGRGEPGGKTRRHEVGH